MSTNRPFCLSIAGFDPTAGAGVLADVKTFESFGVYGMAIITSNTLQTDSKFVDVHWIELKDILNQMELLMNVYDFKALKIGLVENFETLFHIISTAKRISPAIQIVWDPILRSSSGYDFFKIELEQLRFLEQNCTLITPNWDEFIALWGKDPELLPKMVAAILIKGGHRTDKPGCDMLYHNGSLTEIAGEPFNGISKHGTGCVLSSAIGANLANGASLFESCTAAKFFIEKFILSNNTNLGYHL